jgi:glycine cleavage system H protein
MSKWKTVRVKQELVAAATQTLERGRYKSLSEFVSDAIQLRLDELRKSHKQIVETRAEYPVIQERLLYSSNHMWAMVTPEGNVKVGLSDYAQEHLEGMMTVQTHPVGSKVEKGEPLGVIETWMFMFDLFSPVSGKITRINEVLRDEPFAVNKDPYEMLWIAEIKPNNLVSLEEELRDLMRLFQYKMRVSKLIQPRILSI